MEITQTCMGCGKKKKVKMKETDLSEKEKATKKMTVVLCSTCASSRKIPN